MDVLPLFPEITRRFIAERREQSMHRCIAHVEKVIRDGGMRTCDASIVAGMGALSESFLTRFVVGKGERLAIGVGCHGSDFDFTALSPESEGADSVKLCAEELGIQGAKLEADFLESVERHFRHESFQGFTGDAFNDTPWTIEFQ